MVNSFMIYLWVTGGLAASRVQPPPVSLKIGGRHHETVKKT
ncbi:hypothetical protein L579_1435 [Pantoea sp. AS-PWVM4]|nr:hypothetical protein L579_1435 [Pantoea sp. AS-PWVM4]